jgi:hypothetical protein
VGRTVFVEYNMKLLILCLLALTLIFSCGKQNGKNNVQDPSNSNTTLSQADEAPKKEGFITNGVSYGYFLSIESQDYEHFNFKDENGNELSYFYLRELKPMIDVDLSNPSTDFKDKKLKIYWSRINKFLPEPNEVIELEEITGLEYAQ